MASSLAPVQPAAMLPPRPESDLFACVMAAAAADTSLRFVDHKRQARVLSYATLATAAQRIACELRSRGVQPGERVALMFPTSPAFVASFFGVLAAGAVPMPLYPPQRLGKLTGYLVRLDGMLRAGDAKLLLGAKMAVRLVRPGLSREVVPRGTWAIDALEELAQISLLPEVTGTRPDDVALVQFSSGTTGEPKPVALSHRQLLANIDAMRAVFASRPPASGVHSAVSWLPLYHDMGLVGSLLTALREQAWLTLIAPEQFVANPALWLQTVSDFGATISAAPSFAYALCKERISDRALDGVDLSRWQFALNGAEPIDARAAQAFCERFARWGLSPRAMTPVYGLAEAGLGVSFSAPDEPLKVLPAPAAHVCVGRALPGYDMRIVGGDGAQQQGSIEVRGPSVTGAGADGWLATGDEGVMVDGELYVCGRAKDIIIVRGRNHAAQSIEAAVHELPFVRRGCVVAGAWRDDARGSEALVLLVERRRGVAADAASDLAHQQAVAQALQREVGLVAQHIVLVAPGTLPRTSSGKLRRRAAIEAWAQGELMPPARSNIFSVLRQLWRARSQLRRPSRG